MASQLITDPRGLLTSALLRLPELPPILILCVYAPPSDEESRQYIISLISVLLEQYPVHLLMGDFNFQLLSHYILPSKLISSIKTLYNYTTEQPLVNGRVHGSEKQHRGLCQWCPLSPLIFNLYLNTILHHITSTMQVEESFSLHAFIDDILIRTRDKTLVQTLYKYVDSTVRKMGLCMNVKKTEPHALNAAPHFSFTSSSGTLVCMCDKNNSPHSYYKYLGHYIFVNHDPELLFQLLQSEIRTFFCNLQPLPLMLHELVLLYNIQLVPTMCYRMLMHSLPPPESVGPGKHSMAVIHQSSKHLLRDIPQRSFCPSVSRRIRTETLRLRSAQADC